ncbi:hypothetical protein BCR37DRAFT_385034 [Protomyces lactucae-debilis]|uniref:BSD domain-containing protein n=1 Tax=Protomyces lactucae-debilis TaxID=2754530 RepID=A0A1Y2FWR5_PROLT|nr:uncharacterized protein BCR37DRAFT_385034 [Protomyces lactucae-debilis]ORY87744.1 hypothetical protein BCR37DRAFT_385034 [Protomyces lactucae-debilis]
MTADSATSDPGPSRSASTVVFDNNSALSEDALVEERILHLMSSPALFLQLDSTTPDWTAFEQFDEAFSVEENEEEITTLQERHPTLSKTMHALVPELLTQDQAWARFFFLSAQIRLGRPVNLRQATSNEAPEKMAARRPQRQQIQLTSSFETVKVSEPTRSVSQLSEASYDFVSRQHSPSHSTSNFSMPDDGL